MGGISSVQAKLLPRYNGCETALVTDMVARFPLKSACEIDGE
jgi:hypothetical protein